MSTPHAVDIPITNLDDDDDDLLIDDGAPSTTTRLDPSVLRDDFDLDNGEANFFAPTSFATKVKDILARFAQRGYRRVPEEGMLNGIELTGGRFGSDADSFDLSDDEFIARRQRDTVLSRVLEQLKQWFVYILILGLLIAVIVLSAMVGKKGKSTDKQKVVMTNGTDVFHPTTIFISLDGFHPHYISKELTPTLHDFLQKEYGAPYMIPSFPSSTFPNHWTMATGLYPESHGIIGNKFYDPVQKKQFINVLPEKSLDPAWWGGEPIWSTAELQGVRAAIHMYPGSEVKFAQGNSEEVDPFNATETLEVKTDRVLGWLDRPVENRPQLIISYVPTIDKLGHHYGIHGKELENGLKYVDTYLKNITQGIEDRNLTDIVNLVIVSDHGMSPTSDERLIFLDDIVNITKIQYTDSWPLFGLRPFPEFTVDEIYEELQSTFEENKGYKVYLRENLPKEWNFGHNLDNVLFPDRIAPVWVVPETGYIVTTYDELERKGGSYTPKGVHGYNNTEVLMRAIFLGTGPYFKERALEPDASYKVKPFHNVEVYNILCDTLGLTPAQNNGTAGVISAKNMLPDHWQDPHGYPSVSFKIGELLKEDSTYDAMFRPQQDRQTTTLEQEKQKTTEKEQETKVEETKTTEEVKEPTAEEKQAEETITEQKQADETTTEQKQSEETHHKGFWESIEDGFEDLQDSLEDLGDDIKEGAEDLVEDIEDAIDDLRGD